MKPAYIISAVAYLAFTSPTLNASGDITVPEARIACGTLSGKGVVLVLVNNRRTYFKIDCGKEHYL